MKNTDKQENRIFKTIPSPAPRGEIRDRYGKLIAGNRPSFTVQMMKNEIDDERLNDVILNLINILEKNGDEYNDEFPIVFSDENGYEFTYDIELRNWKVNNGFADTVTAKETFDLLRRRYNIEKRSS